MPSTRISVRWNCENRSSSRGVSNSRPTPLSRVLRVTNRDSVFDWLEPTYHTVVVYRSAELPLSLFFGGRAFAADIKTYNKTTSSLFAVLFSSSLAKHRTKKMNNLECAVFVASTLHLYRHSMCDVEIGTTIDNAYSSFYSAEDCLFRVKTIVEIDVTHVGTNDVPAPHAPPTAHLSDS